MIFCVFFAFFIFQSCNRPAAKQESIDAGTANFAVDASCEPIVEQEAYIFESLNKKAKPNIQYRTENEVLRLLLNDTVRLAILSRDLTPSEVKVMNSRTLPPIVNRFAIDAIALIVNQASKDTLITVGDIKKMLNGQAKTDRKIVFDNPNSSLVRYLTDLSGNKEFKQKNIYALKDNKEVIKYVSKNPDAIGITGFSWLSDPDSDYADAVSKVKIVGVKDEASKTWAGDYFWPSQTTMALKQYPLTRGLYVINCTGKMGLGSGFAYFVMSDRGQRIILRSGLLPDSIPPREINIKYTF